MIQINGFLWVSFTYAIVELQEGLFSLRSHLNSR